MIDRLCLLFACASLVSCAPSIPSVDPAENQPCPPSDADTDVALSQGNSATLVYVISQVAFDRSVVNGYEGIDTSASNPHTGFNVDGRLSDENDVRGCVLKDYVSIERDLNAPCNCLLPSRCKGGIDNAFLQLAELLTGVVGDLGIQQYTPRIASREIVMLLRIRGVDNLENDQRVRVAFYRGFPAFSSECQRMEPDRPFVVDAASLRAGSQNIDDARFEFEGRIEDGRLRVSPLQGQHVPFPIALGDVTRDVPLHDMQFRIDLRDGGARGVRGNLGGWFRAVDLRPIGMILGFESNVVDGTLSSFIDVVDTDLPVDALQQCINARDTRPANWGGVSFGVGFELVRATLVSDQAVGTRPAGVCGS